MPDFAVPPKWSSAHILKAVRFEGFRNFVPKHAFTRYCWLTTDSLVKRDHGPPAGGAASFSCHAQDSLRRLGCIRRAVVPMKTEDRRVCPSCGNEFSGAVVDVTDGLVTSRASLLGPRRRSAAARGRARPSGRARARRASARRAAAACTAGSSRCDGSMRAGFRAQPLAQAAMSGSAP